MEYEYSLVFFTVFGQLSAGIVLMISLAGLERFPGIERTCWITAAIFLVVAFAAAILHLQNPWHAPYTITQVGHAWLSREILFGGIFGVAVLVRLFRIAKEKANYFISILAICFVFVMTQIYAQNSVVPLWDNAGAVISFLCSMLLAGSVALPLLYNGAPDTRVIKTSLVSFIIGGLGALVMPTFWVKNIGMVDPLITSSFTTAVICLSLTQITLTALGGTALIFGEGTCRQLKFAGSALVIVGIILGRMMFYASNLKLGF